MTSQVQPPSRQRRRRLDGRYLARYVREAVRERLLYPAPQALRAVERGGDAVVLRLNSGGNALAVVSYLRLRGYRAEWAGTNPDGYGCAVRVTCPAPPRTASAAGWPRPQHPPGRPASDMREPA